MSAKDFIYNKFPNTVNDIRGLVSDAKGLLHIGGGTTVDSDGFSHSSGKFGYTLGDTVVDSVLRAANPVKAIKDSFPDISGLLGGSSASSSGSGFYYPGDSSGSPGHIQLNYPNAALAQLYGMDSETAYQEALANTAIQRRMMDYKAAGLNPVLAAHYNSGADSFSGSALSVVSGASGGSGYIPTSAGNGSSAKGFSDLMKNSNYRSALAAVASAGTMAATKSFQLGAAAYYGVKGFLNSKYGRR